MVINKTMIITEILGMEFKVFNIKLKLSSNNPLYMYILFALINMECPYSVKTSLSVHADNYHSEKWFCDVFFILRN